MPASSPPLAERVSVVVITHNRVNEVLGTLARLLAAARNQGHLLSTMGDVVRGMPWVWQNRHVILHHVEMLYRLRNRTGF